MTHKLIKSLMLLSLATIVACGGSSHITDTGDVDEDGNPIDTVGCVSNDECPDDGICSGGVCEAAPTCSSHAECPGDSYCHFPSTYPWSDTVVGECATPCSGDDSCGVIGQTCVDNRCYTGIDCEPSLNSTDCPPGEVCNSQGRVCAAPPSECYFNEQCPANWICSAENKCIDPGDLGGSCTLNADCDTVTGCEAGCTCDEGSCVVEGSCSAATVVTDCGETNYCASGVCQPALQCSGNDVCIPYGLLCVQQGGEGYCINPEPCDNGACSQTDAGGTAYECNDAVNPPACYPEGVGECSRDDMCETGEYCDLFNGTCNTGCGSDADCTDGLFCQQDHSCGTSSTAGVGGGCSDDNDCPGGTGCFLTNSADEFLCIEGMELGDCPKSCIQACDLLTSMVSETCPAGTTCGGDDSLTSFLAGVLGPTENSNASACYPTTAP